MRLLYTDVKNARHGICTDTWTSVVFADEICMCMHDIGLNRIVSGLFAQGGRPCPESSIGDRDGCRATAAARESGELTSYSC